LLNDKGSGQSCQARGKKKACEKEKKGKNLPGICLTWINGAKGIERFQKWIGAMTHEIIRRLREMRSGCVMDRSAVSLTKIAKRRQWCLATKRRRLGDLDQRRPDFDDRLILDQCVRAAAGGKNLGRGAVGRKRWSTPRP